jgi:hypothetical protein
MDVCMFARIDDEIMRCKKRLVFLTQYTAEGPLGNSPKLTWDSVENTFMLADGKTYSNKSIFVSLGDGGMQLDDRLITMIRESSPEARYFSFPRGIFLTFHHDVHGRIYVYLYNDSRKMVPTKN